MHCTGCFKEIEVSNKAYATAIGSIGQNLFSEEGEYGFYASEVEPWITVLCVDCGRTVHDFILKKLQANHLWWLFNPTIILGDSRKMKEIADEAVHLVITSPS